MRWLALGCVGVLRLVQPAEAACVPPPFNIPFVPGPMVESTPPSAITAGELVITRFEDSSECAASTELDIRVSATDDTTPSDQLGVRVRIGNNSGDQLPSSGVLVIRFRGADSDFDFDLGLSAIDQSGNVGPELVIPIHDDAPGCNAGGRGSLLFPVAVALGLVARRRRRWRPGSDSRFSSLGLLQRRRRPRC